ncbi:cation:proton antiporter [Engelhardtia mirabilis]|uniref:PTS system mannose-specific EIIBCA component n=1 Tax=Engelhardtia mirabilis TaxID=2528011 RepID=A0A518BLX8_9BACT|nr:PTS system mannose-specific EIIBCA component [Planctomycetes bacterium Pla133]QDV02307.1 PTS system mannose-specific EIIBCA component [Planctomycetes bacterium Pla86]
MSSILATLPILRDQPLIQDASPMLVLGVVLALGMVFGAGAKKLRLPGVTAQILAGFLAGSSAFNLLDGKAAIADLAPLSKFALAVIAVAVGSHLNLRRLRNAGARLSLLLIGELTVLPAFVFAALMLLTPLGTGEVVLGTALAGLMAATSIETSPATTLALVREARARGVMTKTLLASVALSSIACILVFELVHSGVTGASGSGAGPGAVLLSVLETLGLAILLGGGIGVALTVMTRRTTKPERLVTLSLAGVVLCSGLASRLGTSDLLACLMLGLVQANLLPAREKLIDSVLVNFQPAIFAVFFTLAGMKLDPSVLLDGGLIALVLFGARAVGKLVVADVAMRLARAPDGVRRNLGLARLPQAAIAIGLLLVAQSDPVLQPGIDLLVAVVLAVVTLNEIVGPVLTRMALVRSGESNMDRMRLIDFIHEENITTRLSAETPEEAIKELTELLVESHHLPKATLEPLLQSVLDREAQVSTVLGGGLMIPHGVLEQGDHMLGAMALSSTGLPFPSPDGNPVHCVVLLATPRGQRDRHLEVLAALARTIGGDPNFRRELFASQTPAHAYELLHSDEAEHFNYYLPVGAEGWGAPRASSPI